MSARLTVDLAALVQNAQQVRRRVGPASMAAVVKADAYGLGAAQVVQALAMAGCGQFFVAHAAEACAIRPFVPHAQIFVLHGFDASAAGSFRDFRLTPVLNTPGQIKAYAGTGITLPAAVHIDTGMARLGLAPDEIAAALSLTNIALVMSHLACGDDPASPMNARQLADFNAARQSLPTAPASIAASGGTFLGSDFLLDLVRPGICLYGGAPHPGLPNPMLPVVRLTAPILQLREIDSGQSAGYGATYVAQEPRRLATLGIGYADGILRSASNRGSALVGGVRCPFAGRVSMDLVIVDVTDAPRDAVFEGGEAVLIGPELTLDMAAEAAGTAAYEIITRLGPRIARRYVGG